MLYKKTCLPTARSKVILFHKKNVSLHTNQTCFNMNDVEKAVELIKQANIQGFFNFLDEKGANSFSYNNLKQEFIRKTYIDTYFPERCEAFAREFFRENNALKFLTDLRRSATFQFVGRQDYLEKLQASLVGKFPVVLVNGTGGEGKTTLVREYAYENRNDYDYILWLEQISSLRSAFADNQELTADLGFRQEPIEERFNRVMQKLRNLKGNNLLVIDNYTQIEEEKGILNDLLHSSYLAHWKKLFTSREQVSYFQNAQITLEHLSETDALQLFKTHCKKIVDEQELKELLKLIDYHALTVELLAKNYQKSRKFNSLTEVTKILVKKSIDDALLQELIQVSRNTNIPEKTKVYEYLLKIFAIEPLQEDEIFILKQFVVLPPLPIVGKDFLTWIQDSAQKYSDTLDSLAEKGWLAYNAENDTFKMHRLVQMVLLKRLKPSLKDNEKIYQTFDEKLVIENIYVNPLKNKWLMDYGLHLLNNFSFSANELHHKTHFMNQLSSVFQIFEKYEVVENLLLKALSIGAHIFSLFDDEIITYTNNLCNVYQKQWRFSEAEELLIGAIKVRENLSIEPDKHISFLTLLNNLGLVYKGQKKYQEAIDIYKKALNLAENIDNTTNNKYFYFATLHNLGSAYIGGKKYEDAFKLYETVDLAYIKNVNVILYGNVLNSMAMLLDKLGNKIQSELMYLRALEAKRNALGENSNEYATTLNNFGKFCMKILQFERAVKLLNLAYKIRLENLGSNHFDTQDTKEALEKLTNFLEKKQETP